MRPPRFPTLVLLLSIATALPALAATPSEQVPIGARAIAMGGAFSSLADDATALFWNPAGLARIGHQEIIGAHANLFDSGIKDDFAAFVLPLSLRHAAAIDWYHSGFDDAELGFGENRVDLAYSFSVRSLVSFGFTAKYLTRSIDLDGFNVRQGRGAGFDLGVLATPIDRVRLGLVAQDLFGTEVHYDGSGSDVAYPRNVRVAASYSLGRAATFAADVDDRWHLGVEGWPLEQVALRAGLEKDREGIERATYAYGLGVKVGVFRFDYARQQPPELDPTNHFSLGMEFNFNPAQIRIEKVAARDLYTSLYKSYTRDGFGSVQVRNLQDRPIAAKLKVFVPGLMDSPSEQDVVLRPKVVQDIPLTAVFPKNALATRGDRPIEVQVAATYQSRRLTRTEKGTGRCFAYAPGAIDWGQGVAQAAAFVTVRDDAVAAVALEASRALAAQPADAFPSRNVGYAAALTDALAAMGVAYLPDPNNPYASISEKPHAVDTVNYPAETLDKRAGDCDDTSVLMAALLGNLGVETRFVDAPGHLFLLVNTGVHERNRLALAVDDAMLVPADEEIWIPLETTAIGKGFAQAWKLGADNYASWAARGQLSVVDVGAAQVRYEPSEAPGVHRSPSVDMTALRTKLEHDTGELATWRRQYLASRFGDTPQNVEISAEAVAKIAHVYLLAGRIDEARAKLESVLARDPRSAIAHNNLGATDVARGDVAGAIRHYEAALAADSADAGIRLNLALVRALAGDTTNIAPLATAVAKSGGFASACRLLGVGAEESNARQGTDGSAESEVRRLLRTAATQEGTSGATRARTAPATAPALSIPESRGAELRRVLYWKF